MNIFLNTCRGLFDCSHKLPHTKCSHSLLDTLKPSINKINACKVWILELYSFGSWSDKSEGWFQMFFTFPLNWKGSYKPNSTGYLDISAEISSLLMESPIWPAFACVPQPKKKNYFGVERFVLPVVLKVIHINPCTPNLICAKGTGKIKYTKIKF